MSALRVIGGVLTISAVLVVAWFTVGVLFGIAARGAQLVLG